LHPFDQTALNHAGRERPERLVALEGQERQVVQRGPRVLVEVPERIPLNEGDAKRTKSGVERTMVAHLEAFDREADGLDRPGHLTALVISLL
jgi:hypothetical protein